MKTSPINTRQTHHCLPSQKNQDEKPREKPANANPSQTQSKKDKPSSYHPPARVHSLLSRHLNTLRHAVGLAAVDLLARLGNRLEHLGIRQRLLGHDRRRLRVERDLVGFDA